MRDLPLWNLSAISDAIEELEYIQRYIRKLQAYGNYWKKRALIAEEKLKAIE